MGLFDKSKDSHLDEKYRKYLQKEKGYKALQCLEKRVELGYSELSAARTESFMMCTSCPC